MIPREILKKIRQIELRTNRRARVCVLTGKQFLKRLDRKPLACLDEMRGDLST